MERSGFEIYQAEGGKAVITVVLDKDTVWLNLNQMTELFQRDKSVVSRHLRNIFSDRELDREAVVAKNATTAVDGKSYLVEYYNLDVIISVGYRIKSQRGTQFRLWANKILKDYLIKGYSINEVRIKEQNRQLKSLQQTVKLLGSVLDYKKISNEEGEGLIKVISDYAFGLDVLDQYDYQTLEIIETSGKETFRLTYDEAIRQIAKVKAYFGNNELFGREKDDSFKGSLSTIYQTFEGADLYPSVEEKAANLLYFVTKDHSFSDGNKRIAAFLFLYFMERNGILYDRNGNKRIADNALVALTLMIAVSRPEEKDIMVKVIVNLINRNN